MKTEILFATWKDEISNKASENVKLEFFKRGKSYFLRVSKKGVERKGELIIENLFCEKGFLYEFKSYVGKRKIDDLKNRIIGLKSKIFERFEDLRAFELFLMVGVEKLPFVAPIDISNRKAV